MNTKLVKRIRRAIGHHPKCTKYKNQQLKKAVKEGVIDGRTI